jgi:hypothetical protein
MQSISGGNFLAIGTVESEWISSELTSRVGLPAVGRAYDALGNARSIATALRYFSETRRL